MLAAAQAEADRLGDRHLGTEHLLLGLLAVERCLPARVFFTLGLNLRRARELEGQEGS